VVRQSSADLDYEREHEFNTRNGINLGVMRLHFADADRTQVDSVEWKDANRKRFQAAAVELVHYVPPKPIPYAGPGTKAQKVLRPVRERPGQERFRRHLKLAYGNCCSLSGCQVADVLDGAHIDGYVGPDSDNIQNGLLLRRDLHALFDHNLIGIDPATSRVYFAPETHAWNEYRQWSGQATLRMPPSVDCRPSREALARRWKRFVDAHGLPDHWKPGSPK
jgi:hypothetical protein